MALVQITLMQKVKHYHEKVSLAVSPESLSKIIQNIILSFLRKKPQNTHSDTPRDPICQQLSENEQNCETYFH